MDGQDNVETLKKEVMGDPKEAAILRYIEYISSDVMAIRAKYKKIHEIPFRSQWCPRDKLQMCVYDTEDPDEKGQLLIVTGAPETILEQCSTILVDGVERPITEEIKTWFEHVYKELGGNYGETLIGFCDIVTKDWDPEIFPHCGLRFVGVMSLKAKIRPYVYESVPKCHSAGIKIIMATGDHPITAEAIARKVGIIDSEASPYIVTGEEFEDMTIYAIEEALNKDNVIFARITHRQRFIIAENLRDKKDIVAITGDNMNDAPSLRISDIGAALGKSGTDVCKTAADVILREDDFTSLVMGIEEARLYFDNLKTNFAYNIFSIIPEVILFALFFRVENPDDLNIVVVLYIVLTTLLAPVISMVCSKSTANVMKRQPRNLETDFFTQNVMLIAVIKKISTLLLSGIVAIKMPSIILLSIALRIVMSGILSWVAIQKISDDFPSIITLKDDMSRFPSIKCDTNDVESKKNE